MLLGGMTIEYSKVPADICLFSSYFFIKNTIFDKKKSLEEEKYKVQRERERQFFNEILYLYQEKEEKMNFRILENKMSEWWQMTSEI